jgi:hypothetical protein
MHSLHPWQLWHLYEHPTADQQHRHLRFCVMVQTHLRQDSLRLTRSQSMI